MKSKTYYGSGWSETIINIGDDWPLVHSAICTAIDRYKKDFVRLCEATYKDKSLSIIGPYEIKKIKKDIRKLQRLSIAILDGVDSPFYDYELFKNNN